MQLYQPTITGSLLVSGSIVATGGITVSGSIDSASYAATASFVTLSQTASFVTTAQTASFVTTAQTASFVANAQSASNAVTAQTASYANALTVAGTLTAQTLVVQTITSSVDFVTGSTKFGSLSSNTHVFTGSMAITGGLVDINKDGQSLRIFPQTSSGSARIQLQNSGSAGLAGANAIIAVEGVTGNEQFTSASPFSFAIGTATQKAFHLGANSAVVMTITGSNVGIGTTNPLGSSVERTIHLSDGGAGYTTLYITNGTNSLRGIFAIGDAASTISIGTQTNHTLRIVTNDTPRIYITNGGNVGIGTSNPGNIVHAMYSSTGTVNYYDGARYMIQQSSATANNFAGISFLGSGGSDAAAIWTIISSHTVGSTTGALVFGTTNSGGASTERMRITGGGEVGIGGITPTSGNRFWVRGSSSSSSDTSIFVQNSTPSTLFSVRNDGVVTKPLQPAFRAGRSSSYAPGANTVIVFNSTSGFGFNIGGHYNTSNGRFTAPVNGIYNFTACIIWESVGGGQAMDDAFEVKVNGSTAAYSFRRAAYVANTTGIGGYYVDHATVLLNLTAGQYVEVQNRYNLTVHGNQNYCYFTGYLVG